MTTDTYSIQVAVDSTSAVTASRNLSAMEQATGRSERALLSLGNMAKAASAALLGIGFKTVISEMASFETQMIKLKSLTDATTQQMKAMEKQARELGATTAFSAQQAAEAQGVLASAGLKTNEILTATPKVLQLAAAGSLDLAKAAEISTGTMKALGLQLGDLGRINDVFAKTAADSSTNVEQIGDAMKNIAPVAKTFGINLETLTASLGILADNQIKGSEAGNNLKTMLVALSNDTKDNVEILKKHGVTYKQLNVEVYGLAKVMKTLQDAHLTGAESLKIFGSDAAAAGNILAANSTKIDEYAKKLENADGSAKKMADTLNQGLAKAFDALKGTLSEAALQLGDSGLKGALTDVIQQATGVIAIYEGMGDKFAESNNYTKEQYDNLKSVADELKIVAGAAGGIAALTGAIWAANAAMLAFNVATRANPLIMGATVVAAAAGATFAKIADNQSTIDKQIETAEKRIAAMEKYGLPNLIGTAVGFDTEKERTKLTALKQFKEEQLAATKATIDATAKTEKHTEAAKTNAVATADSTDKTKKTSEAKKEAAKATKDLAEAERYFNEQLNAQVASAENAGKLFAAQQQTKIAALEAERVSISDKAAIEYESAKTYEEKSRILNESQSATNLLLAKEKEIRDSLTNQSAETIDAKIAAAQAELDNAGKYNLTLAEQLRLKTEIAGLQTDKAVLAETSTQSDIKAKSDAEQKYNDDKLASIKAISDAQTAANTAASAQMDILTANLETAKEAATGLADAFGSVGGAVGGLGVALASYEKSQAAITDGLQNQLFEIQKLNDGKGDQAKADKAIATASQKQSQLQVKSYGDMASAAQGFFKKGTTGYQVLGAATKVFRAFEMVQSAMSMSKQIADMGKTVAMYLFGETAKTTAKVTSSTVGIAADTAGAGVSATKAVADASQGDPYTGLARGAMMLAFMVAIGAMSGGGGGSAEASPMTGADYITKETDKYKSSQGGTVLGSDEMSNSILDALDTISSNSSADLDYTKGMARSLEVLSYSMKGVANSIAKNYGIDTSSLGLGTSTSGFFMTTTTTKEFAGSGIKFVKDTLGNIVESGIIAGRNYLQTLVTKTSSGFLGIGASTKQYISTKWSPLNDEISASIAYSLGKIQENVVSLAGDFGEVALEKLKAFEVDLGKMPLGKDAAANTEIINGALSKQADLMAIIANYSYADFQQIGEGYYQTLNRVSIAISTAQTKLKVLGINAIEYTDIINKQGDIEREMVTQSLQLASAFTDVNDIIGKLPGTADDIIEAFNGLNSIKAGLSAIGASGLTLSQDLINVAGGISKFDSTLTDYIENYLTKTEQSAYKTGLLTDKFTQLGLVLPVMTSNAEESKTSYRKLLDVLKNDTSDTGRAIYATALGMASDFASAAEDYAAIVKERTDAIKATISTYEDYRIAIYKKLGEQNPVAKEEALRLEREKSMQGMDDLTRKYTTALNQLSDAGAELTSTTTALETAYKNLTAMRDKFVTLGQGLRTYYDQLMSVGKPQATPQEIYNAAKKSFQDTAAEAAKGTESALASLPEVSKAFLEASLKYNATGNAYQADYVSVLKALEKGMSAADRQIEIMNKQLAEAEKANVNLLGVKAKTTDVDSSIALLSTAVNNFSNAMANYTLQVAKVTAVDNTIKTEIANKQTELNQIAANNTANLIKADEEKAARDKAAEEAVLAASEVARRETAAMNDPNYQGNYDEYVISEAAQAAAKAAAEAAVSVGKNSTDAQLDAIKATTSIAIESVAKISNAVIETNSAIQAMADAANNKTYSFNNDAQSLVNLENIAVQAGYSGDYTDTYAMQSYLDSVGYKAYANGGMASGLSLVGEQGAELVNFTSPANVTSHQQTAGLFDSIGNAIDDQSVLLKEQIIELKALVNLQSSANVALINEMQGMKEELSTISRKAKLEAAA
jgi:TP901 family phage tail tape measure protein